MKAEEMHVEGANKDDGAPAVCHGGSSPTTALILLYRSSLQLPLFHVCNIFYASCFVLRLCLVSDFWREPATAAAE